MPARRLLYYDERYVVLGRGSWAQGGADMATILPGITTLVMDQSDMSKEQTMFARITIAHGAPEKLDTGLAALRKGLRAGQEQVTGFKGLYVLVDRATGKHVTVSLWETREDAEMVSELAPHMQGRLVEAFGISGPPTHEIYEVAVEA
jgi:heme-degrading monooxygenase HmoA